MVLSTMSSDTAWFMCTDSEFVCIFLDNAVFKIRSPVRRENVGNGKKPRG